jgi:hypothetical protein
MPSSFCQAYHSVEKKSHKFDAFGQPVHLFFEGNAIFKSSIGAFLTFLVVLPITAILIYELYVLFQRASFTADEELDYFQEPPLFNYKDEDVIFAVGSVDLNAGVNRSNAILNVALLYTVITRYPNGSLIGVDTPVPLQPCTLSTFLKDALNDRRLIEAQYNRSLIDNFMCARGLDYDAYGDSDSPVYAFFQIQANVCVNGTDNYTTCATPEFISNYFATTTQIALRLYLMNNALNVQNYKKPFAYYIDEIRWYLSPGVMKIYSDIFLRRATVNTMDNYFGLGNGYNATAMSFQQDRRDKYYDTPAPAPLITVNLRPGNYVIVVHRSYSTLGAIFSVVGGTLSILVHAFGRMGRFINKRRYMAALAEKMINELDMSHHHHSASKDEELVNLKPETRSPRNYGAKKSGTLVSESFLHGFKELIKRTKNGYCFFQSSATKVIWDKAMAHVSQEIEVFTLLQRLRALELNAAQATKNAEKGSSYFNNIDGGGGFPSKKLLFDDSNLNSATLPPASTPIPNSTTDRNSMNFQQFNIEIMDKDVAEEKPNITVRTSSYN